MSIRSSALSLAPWLYPPGHLAYARGLAATRSAALVTLACAVIVTRVPFHVAMLDHWDSVQYALGLEHFNVAAHMPQPPGSPFYVLLGRLLLTVTGNAHTGFFLTGVVASIGAVGTLFLFTGRVFGRAAAWIAALTLLTQPPFWFYGAAGNAWTMLALLSSINGFLCWRALNGAPRAALVAAIALGLSSGFRLDVTVFMAPLWVWCAWRGGTPRKMITLGIATIATGVALWLVPVVLITPGGLELWWTRLYEMFAPSATSAQDEAHKLVHNTAVLWAYVVALLGPLAVCGLLVSRRTLRRRWHQNRDTLTFFALWALPSFAFLWGLDTTEAGHNLLFTMAVLPLVAGLVAGAPVVHVRRVRTFVACLVVAQAAAFVLGGPPRTVAFAAVLDPGLTAYNAVTLRAHEHTLRDTLDYIRSTQDPGHSLVATVYGQAPYRFMMYYLPDYRVIRVQEPGDVVRLATNRSTVMAARLPCVDAQVESLVWVTEGVERPEAVPPGAVPVAVSDRDGPSLWRVWLDDPAREVEPLPGLRRCPAARLN